MILKRFLISSLTLNYLYAGALDAAQHDNLEQVVVVANKIETPINQVAANVTVLSRDEISDNLSTSINQVFRYTPGIDTESAGTRFGIEGINIRGIGGNRVALLIDGVPLSDQFDIGNFSNATRDFINAGLIQRTEVLHGSASSLYGSDAIGGVVAVYTPDPVDIMQDNEFGGEVLSTYRNADQSSHLQAMVAAGSSSLSFLGAASWRDGHELEPIEHIDNPDQKDYQRKSVLLKVVADNHLGHSWRVGFIHQNSESQSDQRSVLGNGRFRSTTKLLGDDDNKMDLLSLQYNISPTQSWVDSGVVRAYYQSVDVSQTTVDERLAAKLPVSIERLFSYDQTIQGLELNLLKEFNSESVSHRLGFGIEYQGRRTKELRDGTQTTVATGESSHFILGESFPLRDFPISESEKLGAYLDYNASFGKWNGIAALRADHYKLKARGDAIYREDNPSSNVIALSESDISPKLGLIYHITPASDIYIQYSHGFRAPPFEDANIGLDIPLFNIRAIANPDLKSESSDGVDIGYRWHNNSASFHVSLFRTNYDDFIETKVRLGMDPVSGRVLFQSQNISEAVIKGVEAGWTAELPRNFDVTGSFYLAEGNNRDNHQSLNSVGPEQLAVGLGWSAPDKKRSVQLRGTFTEKWDERDQSSDELYKPDGYAVFDLYFRQQITEHMMFRASVNNLTDKKYWNWSDVQAIETDDPVLPVLTRPGRTLSLSLGINW